MKKALIVYGYYDQDDHYGELLTAVKKKLQEKKFDEINVVNTFSFTQKHLKNNSQDLSAPTAQWYRGLRTEENTDLIKSEQDKILNATHIIFIYPIWWESLPHYMTTWVSEVFRSVSFRVDDSGRPNPQWGGDRQVMIITTAGFSQEIRRENFLKLPTQNCASLKEKSQEEVDAFINLAQAYPLLMALNYAGLKVSKELHLCGVEKGNEAAVLAAVNQGMNTFLPEASVSASPPIVAQFKHHQTKRKPLQRELKELLTMAEKYKPQEAKRKRKPATTYKP